MVKMIKIKTIYGKVLTLTITKQTFEFIEGLDKNGVYCKILLSDIENACPFDDEEVKKYEF